MFRLDTAHAMVLNGDMNTNYTDTPAEANPELWEAWVEYADEMDLDSNDEEAFDEWARDCEEDRRADMWEDMMHERDCD